MQFGQILARLGSQGMELGAWLEKISEKLRYKGINRMMHQGACCLRCRRFTCTGHPHGDSLVYRGKYANKSEVKDAAAFDLYEFYKGWPQGLEVNWLPGADGGTNG